MQSYFRPVCFAMAALLLSPSWSLGQLADEPAGTTELPQAIASFGAVTLDGWIYVYSGHIGTAHDHSRDNLSQSFQRRRVAGGNWEDLPMEAPLQGLALVAHDGFVYRVGGMTAKNAAGEEPQLYSTDVFAKFDPATKQWTTLTSMPEGRSSHAAVVIGSRIYVVGGWTLSGDGEGEWLSKMLVFDLEQPQGGWIAQEQPFQRRALAVSNHDGKLYAIGGMNEDELIDRKVDIFDPATGEWSAGPELPGEGMNGFGVSAWNSGNGMLVSGSDGIVFRLAANGATWEEVTRLRTPRFFHQLVPAAGDDVLAVGGASRQGHLSEIELIRIGR